MAGEGEIIRVFVSSTYLDNETRRAAVREAIERAGMVPIAMERFESSVLPPLDVVRKYLAQADLLVVIVGWRYGSSPPGSERSYTELEYEAMPGKRLMFVLRDDVAVVHGKDTDGDPALYPKAVAFRARARQDGPTTQAFASDVDLVNVLWHSLTAWKEARAQAAAAPAPRPRAARRPRAGQPPTFSRDLENYRGRIRERLGVTTLMGFGSDVRVPLDLDTLCVPLDAIASRALAEDADFDDGRHASERLGAAQVRIALTEAFRTAKDAGERRAVLVLGDPGSGKTTHLRQLAHWTAGARDSTELGLDPDVLPVFVPLRDCGRRDVELDDALAAAIAAFAPKDARDLPRRVLQHAHLLFLLDGLDEVASEPARRVVARWIEQLHDRYRQARFVVTCRYAGYGRGVRLPPSFLELHLRPLNEEQIAAFVHRWHFAVEQALPGDRSRVREEAERKAGILVERLQAPKVRLDTRVFELAANPLLLTTICLVYRDRNDLPKGRERLYDDCVRILLEYWRKAKQIPSTVDPAVARAVLEPLALWLHQKEKRTRASADELAKAIGPVLAQTAAKDVAPAAFLAAVRDESGILTGWSNTSFGFLHLGFQEYLAACAIRRGALAGADALPDLARHFGASWWKEVTRLTVALDGGALFEPLFRHVVPRPEFAANSELVEKCIADAVRASPAPFLEVLKAKRARGKAAALQREAAERALRLIAPAELEKLPRRARAAPAVQRAKAEIDVVQGIEFVRIPGGTFRMGAPAGEEGSRDHERPVHEVAISPFRLGRFPVTNGQYKQFLTAHPQAKLPESWSNQAFNGDLQPVVGISWEEAVAFCRWLGGSLPTEAQWEYACRAGTKTPYASGTSEKDLERAGWFDRNSGGRTHPVGEKESNAFGLYDLHGNVWEWCADWFGPYSAEPQKDPAGPSSGTGRVLRGGSFWYSAARARSAARYGFHPGDHWNDLGFRVALPAPPELGG